MRIDQVMTHDVMTVPRDTSLRDVARILADRRISGLPVLDEAGKIAGVVTEADVLVKEMGQKERRGGVVGWLLEPDEDWRENKFEARTAGQAMSSPAITVRPTDQVTKAATLMIENGINRVPVVDDVGSVVGIVARADLVRAFTQTDADITREIREDVIQHQFWASPEDLTIEVHEGVVKLAGELETETLAEGLPRMVARVPGVIAVESRLTWVGQK